MRSILIKILIVLIYANVPVSIGVIGYALILLSQAMPIWLFLLCCLSLIGATAGFAALLDAAEKRPSQPFGQ